MFGLGLPEIIIILIVALLVVGPSKLPELARSLGKAFNDFKRMAEDVKETFNEEVVKEVDEIKKLDPTAEIAGEIDEIKNLEVLTETDAPSVKEPIVSAGKETGKPEEEQVEGRVPPVEHAKTEESNKQSGKNDSKAT